MILLKKLLLSFLGIANESKPRVVVLETVPQLQREGRCLLKSLKKQLSNLQKLSAKTIQLKRKIAVLENRIFLCNLDSYKANIKKENQAKLAKKISFMESKAEIKKKQLVDLNKAEETLTKLYKISSTKIKYLFILLRIKCWQDSNKKQSIAELENLYPEFRELESQIKEIQRQIGLNIFTLTIDEIILSPLKKDWKTRLKRFKDKLVLIYSRRRLPFYRHIPKIEFSYQ